MKIGMIGLGRMGSAIARNLIRLGHEVTAWNRSSGPLHALADQGATPAKKPEEALQGEVLLSMLANDAAIRAVGLDGPLLDKAAKGLVHANMATISAGFARALAAAHESRGLGYVAAPVFGRPEAAEAAKLVIVAGGPEATIASLAPVFAAIGTQTVVAGTRPEKANLFKIAGNFMIASAMETMGEAFALLKKGGVDVAQFHDVMSQALFPGRVFQGYGKTMVEEKYEPAGFALSLGLKDVNLARAEADSMHMALPLADLLKAHFDEAVALGWSDKDWSALGGIIAKKAGL